MADVRWQTVQRVRVDKFGNAATIRRCNLLNVGGRPVDLRTFEYSIEVEPGGVFAPYAHDSDGRHIQATLAALAGGKVGVACRFEKTLEPRCSYWAEIGHSHSRYACELRGMDLWVLSQWLVRLERLEALGFDVEEPQHYLFDLFIDDPRSKILGRIRNPVRTFDWDASPAPNSFTREAEGVHLHWEWALKPDERTEEVTVVYRQGWVFQKALAPLAFVGSWFRP